MPGDTLPSKYHFLKIGSLAIAPYPNIKNLMRGAHEMDCHTEQYTRPGNMVRVPHNKANLRAFAKQQRKLKR
jgi:hypothetical protein